MEPALPKINTQRLKPICQRTTRTVMSILENGDISMEILAKPQDGSQVVQEMVHISGDGAKLQLYQNNQGNAGDDGANSGWTHQEFVFPDLPPKLVKKYTHAYRFVELVKSKTPKIVLTTDRAKCKLMENLPAPDFQVDFHDGMIIQLSNRKVHVTDSDGNSTKSDIDKLPHSFPDNIIERYVYSKQCESECQRLVDSFNTMKTNGNSPELFPISIGTNTSPVVITPSQQTTSTDSTTPPSLSSDQTHNKSEAYTPLCMAAAGVSIESPHCNNASNSALSIPTLQHLDQQSTSNSIENSMSSSTSACPQQQFTDPSNFTLTQMIYTDTNNHIPSQTEETDMTEFHIPSNYNQINLLNVDNGANFHNTTIPQTCLNSLRTQDYRRGEAFGYSDPHPVDSFYPLESTPQQTNCAQVPQGVSLSEGYNKLKYCSKMSDDQTDQDQGGVQQVYFQEELFSEHLDMSGLRVTEKEKLPCRCECRHINQASPEDVIIQQHDNIQAGCGEVQATKQSLQSLSDASFHSQTFSSFSSSNDKRNDPVPSPESNQFCIVDYVSPQATTEVDTSNNAFSFVPIQSSSLVTQHPDPNLSKSPQKVQRKALSLDLSAALENQMKSLDLGSSRSDSMNCGTPQSAGSEKYLQNTQNTHLKNMSRNISFNSSFSINKISDRFRVRQDQLNSSLPLSCDSRNSGIPSIPATPQKQFLQSSDISVDKGSSEFGLPPQVRHSLDLSTSSNYSDSPSSSQSSSCEPLYQVFVPYTGWASYYASGAVWVLYNDGTQLGVKANEKTMTYIDQDGSQKKYNNKDIVPDVVKMKLEKFPSILAAVLNCQR